MDLSMEISIEVLEAINRLRFNENSSGDMAVLKDWIGKQVSRLEGNAKGIIENVPLRWNQGQQQALTALLAIFVQSEDHLTRAQANHEENREMQRREVTGTGGFPI